MLCWNEIVLGNLSPDTGREMWPGVLADSLPVKPPELEPQGGLADLCSPLPWGETEFPGQLEPELAVGGAVVWVSAPPEGRWSKGHCLVPRKRVRN